MRVTPSPFSVSTSVVRELLEQHLVAGAAHALAGRGLGRAEDREPHAGGLQDRDEGARDLLARADRTTAPSRRRTGSRGRCIVARRSRRRGTSRSRAQSPRVSAGRPHGLLCDLVGVEHRLQLVRERAVHHHPVLAHPVEARQVLELDRARGLAVAAGRAGPQRVLADDVGDERRQRVVDRRSRRRAPRAASRRWCLRLSLTHFSDSGLPVRNVGQASLQRPHSVQVKASRPSFHVRSRAVRTPTRMSSRVGVLAHDACSRSTVGTALAGRPRRKIQRRQRGDDVEVLAGRQEHEERRTPSASCTQYDALVADAQRGGRQRPRTPRASARRRTRTRARARSPGRAGEQREAEAVEREVGDHDRRDQRQDQQRLAVGLEPRGRRHEAAVEARRPTAPSTASSTHVLQRGEQPAGERPGRRRARRSRSTIELDLAHQQRHEAEEDHRVHDPRLPVARDHPRLQEAVVEHRAPAARAGDPEAVLRLQRRDDRRACARRAQRTPANAAASSSVIPSGLIEGGTGAGRPGRTEGRKIIQTRVCGPVRPPPAARHPPRPRRALPPPVRGRAGAAPGTPGLKTAAKAADNRWNDRSFPRRPNRVPRPERPLPEEARGGSAASRSHHADR